MLKTSWNIQFFFLLACNVKNQYPEHQDSRSPTQMKNKKSRQNGEKKKKRKSIRENREMCSQKTDVKCHMQVFLNSIIYLVNNNVVGKADQ